MTGPALLTGGTGFVGANVARALLAQGLSARDAAQVGVFAHGLAGDRARERVGELGLVATDLLAGLCEVWSRWKR